MQSIIFALIFFLASSQFTVPVSTGAIAATANPCGSMPSFDASYLSTSVSTGFTTWADSSGNSNTLTGFNGSVTVVNTTTATPNGTKTYLMNGTSGQQGTLTNPISTPTSMTVCAVWNMTNSTNSFVMTGNPNAGAWEVGVSGTSPFKQYWNKGFVTGGPTSTAGTSISTWYDGCWVNTSGTSTPWVFYLNGSTNGSGTASISMSQPISELFMDRTSSIPIGALAEIDIKANTITSTDATNVHNCMVSRYGVP